jgi:hypothetical protein
MDDHDEDIPTSELLSAQEGLSDSVLKALLQFQTGGGCFLEEDEDEEDSVPQDPEVLIANAKLKAARDKKVIDDTYRRLQRQEADEAVEKQQSLTLTSIMLDLLEPILFANFSNNDKAKAMSKTLVIDGVARVNNVLDSALCDRCLADINSKLALCEDEGITEDAAEEKRDGFGSIFSRNSRYDMYLHNEGPCEEALAQMLSPNAVLGDLFRLFLHGDTLHEFSSLICDSGAKSQPIHPDTPYSVHAPLWTVFIALQDVRVDMGPTIFLPGTHTLDCHDRLKLDVEQKHEMFASREYRRSLLKKGDCAVMDSRTFHFGDANISEETRRVLMYFTIRNPLHSLTGATADYPPGSIWPDLHMSTEDYE